MAIWDKAQSWLQSKMPRQEAQGVPSNRADGGFSGYQPKVNKKKAQDTTPMQGASGYQEPMHGFTGMMPGGVDMGGMQFQQVGGQTAPMPRQQQGAPVFQQTMGQMPMQTGYQPVFNQPQQPMQYTSQFRQMPPVQPQQGFQPPMNGAQPMGQTGYVRMNQPPMQQPQPQQPLRQEGNITYMPGSFVSEEGSVYKLVLRVAQITSISNCYRLIEFMQNNEAMIVNAEQISDVMEADRCMDLLYGAAYAMNQNFIRVSGKQIYLITPPQVQVQPFEALRRFGEEDIDRRWPDPERSFGNRSYARGFGQHARQDDFVGGFGQRASGGNQAGAYTDYGGFGMKR
ncbi:MAG: cell division protein SepF [Clostridia bacterium]|nr:cell division protein SepF [Clostridia bacterium]